MAAVRWTPFVSVAMENLDDENEIPAMAQDVVLYFYAIGAGSFYNDLILKGVRNTELEKMYVDDDGNPKYPYMFMDLAVYLMGPDGNQKLLEGLLCGGFPPEVQAAAKNIAEIRQDCLVLGDTGGLKTSVTQDLQARRQDVSWNTWNAMLYTQYRQVYDKYTGNYIWITPVYHAVSRHLHCDGAYFIGEPVAGIEKGAIDEPIKLAYIPNHTERGDLMDRELNFTIYEPQGTYFLVQLTTWKRLSVLKWAHVVRFVAYGRKMIPPS